MNFNERERERERERVSVLPFHIPMLTKQMKRMIIMFVVFVIYINWMSWKVIWDGYIICKSRNILVRLKSAGVKFHQSSICHELNTFNKNMIVTKKWNNQSLHVLKEVPKPHHSPDKHFYDKQAWVKLWLKPALRFK